mmetsp:Transcript_15108/g.47453  ORF Transcript_15108/g.47453 Transcript_15108/m.47453 type:complete len:220 (+) Transcript_15108:1315-1974(+)
MREANALRNIVLNSSCNPPMPSFPKSKSELNRFTRDCESTRFFSRTFGPDVSTSRDGPTSCPNRDPPPACLAATAAKSTASTHASSAVRRNAIASFCPTANTCIRYSFFMYSLNACASSSTCFPETIDVTLSRRHSTAMLGVGRNASSSTRWFNSSWAVFRCNVDTPTHPSRTFASGHAVNTQFDPDGDRTYTSTFSASFPSPCSGDRARNATKSDFAM